MWLEARQYQMSHPPDQGNQLLVLIGEMDQGVEARMLFTELNGQL